MILSEETAKRIVFSLLFFSAWVAYCLLRIPYRDKRP
jgi:hypothetical protein